MQTLHTKLSLLEPLCAAHAPEMFLLLSDSRIYERLAGSPPASVEALAERYRLLEKGRSEDSIERWLNWIIRPREGSACAGFVQATLFTSTTGDFAYILGPNYWGRGLAFDAATKVLRTLFAEFGVTSLFATSDRRNERSMSLLRRLGFFRVSQDCYPHGEVEPDDEVFRLDHDSRFTCPTAS